MHSQSQPIPISRKAILAGRIFSALPVLALLFSAAMKLAKPQGVVDGMHQLGYPEHLTRVLGILELSCTIIYLIPRTSVLGAILLTGYLGGAVASHARAEQWVFFMPFIVGVLVWLGLLLREPRLKGLIPLRK